MPYKRKPHVHNAVVFLMDFLGQSDTMARVPTLPLSRHSAKRAADTVNRTSIRCRQLRHALKVAVKGIAQSRAEEIRNWPTPLHKYVKQKPRYTVYGFADTIILALALEADDHPFRVVYALYKLLIAIASFMITSFAREMLPRGGLECGMIQVFSDGEIAGAGVAEAHRLESQVADFPRIVVGGGFLALCRALQDLTTDLPTDEQRNIVLDGLRACVANIEPDPKGNAVYFDYLAFFLGSELDAVERGLVQQAYSFICAESQRTKRTGNRKLIGRLRRLQAYFDRRLR